MRVTLAYTRDPRDTAFREAATASRWIVGDEYCGLGLIYSCVS